MRLSAKMLQSVENVNSWKYSNQAYVYEGQANDVYIQLVDLAKDPAIIQKGSMFPENPMRYVPQGTVIVSATFPSIDDAEEFTAIAVQPFADDKSIWKFALAESQLPNTGYFKLTVSENGVEKTVSIRNAIYTELLNIGGC